MDVLSGVIGSVRIECAEACSIKVRGSWGWRYPPLTVSGFHIVVQGSAWLITAAGPPVELTPGDVVLTPYGAEHGLAHAPSSFDDLKPAVLGDGPHPDQVHVAFVCGAHWLDRGQVPGYPRSLPPVIVVSPDHDRNPHLRLLTDLLGAHLNDTKPGGRVSRSALLDLILTHVLRLWLEENPAAARPHITDPAISAALDEIHAAPTGHGRYNGSARRSVCRGPSSPGASRYWWAGHR
ncbi:cupin domain-containing protein [Streptomyces mirabilis]|uniref:cupin domain-containing protein n=1 Tax=Streptomyces mirabilis TaxID=68239 RepID=UPI00339F7D4C